MTFEQNIPFYIYDFKEYPWKVYHSEHYIFNVEENSLAELEIKSIIERQEKAYKKIVGILNLSGVQQKINYYFYSSQEFKEKLMGDSWYGQTIYNEFTVHAVYNEKDRVVGEHEDTHLLSLEWGLPISLFQEGLAESMVGKSMFGNLHNNVVIEGIKRGLSTDIKELMSQEGWMDTSDEEAEFFYSIAGSFISYLIVFLELEIFKKLYCSMDRKNSKEKNIEIFRLIVGKDFDCIQNDWKLTLN
jgi:hypothetical protein